MRTTHRFISTFPAIFCLMLCLWVHHTSWCAVSEGRPENTTRGNRLRPTGKAMDSILGIERIPAQKYDTIRTISRDDIQLSGYDKPLRTSRETILVTNSTAQPVGGLAVTIKYMDMQGRQLHERTDTVMAEIPGCATRMVHLSTWDSQHSYYYHRGQRPRTAGVTPYDISARVSFILIPVE